jgi:hypothetical protein
MVNLISRIHGPPLRPLPCQRAAPFVGILSKARINGDWVAEDGPEDAEELPTGLTGFT